MRTLDRVFGVLLLLAAAGHTAGTLRWIPPSNDAFIWSLGSSLAAALLGVLNLVRAGRPTDRALAWICLVGTLCWAVLVLAFGRSMGNVLDPRVLMHAISSLALVLFSARTLLRARAPEGSGLPMRPT